MPAWPSVPSLTDNLFVCGSRHRLLIKAHETQFHGEINVNTIVQTIVIIKPEITGLNISVGFDYDGNRSRISLTLLRLLLVQLEWLHWFLSPARSITAMPYLQIFERRIAKYGRRHGNSGR